MNKNGLIQVYTGNGKGKTTAAWGQALRAVGHGWRVAVVRFLKPHDSGEVEAAKCLRPQLSVLGRTSPYDARLDQRKSARLREESRRNFDMAMDLALSGEYDMLVLDEINIVLHYGFVSREEMLDLIQNRPANLDLVLTGRYAPDWLILTAHLVTEMTEVKHPSGEGVGARKGIEF